MSLLTTKDEFGRPCQPCQGYEVGKSPCATATCPPGFRKLENTLVDGGVFRHCAPVKNGVATCKGYKTKEQEAIDKKLNIEKYAKIGIGVIIGLALIRRWQSS